MKKPPKTEKPEPALPLTLLQRTTAIILAAALLGTALLGIL